MATAKMETAADRYRRQAQQAITTHDVKCSCGFEWKCRRTDKQFWITSGILPTSMLDALVKVAKKGKSDPNELLKSVATDELVRSIEFTSKVVKFTAVEPRIVETPTGPNDLGYDEVQTCCYNTLRDWQIKGGDEASNLETFPE